MSYMPIFPTTWVLGQYLDTFGSVPCVIGGFVSNLFGDPVIKVGSGMPGAPAP